MYNYFMLGKIADLLRQCSALLFPRCEVLHFTTVPNGSMLIQACMNHRRQLAQDCLRDRHTWIECEVPVGDHTFREAVG